MPDGVYLEVLPPYSPELQPAERLWQLAGEPLANRCFDSLDELEDILEERCRALLVMQADIKALTNLLVARIKVLTVSGGSHQDLVSVSPCQGGVRGVYSER